MEQQQIGRRVLTRGLRGCAGIATALAVASGFALVAPSPAGAMARPADVADATAPRVMSQAVQQTAAVPATAPALQPFGRTQPLAAGSVSKNPNLQREVFGFVNAGNLASTTVGYRSWHMNLLSTVVYFGIDVNGGGGLITGNTGWNVYISSTMSSFVNAAHASNVRVLLSLNLHDFSTSSTSTMCSALTSTSQQTTIAQAVQQMKFAGIDGINVDYEGNVAACADGNSNRADLVTFVASLRSAMTTAQPGSYLAIDTYSGSAEDNQEYFNITGLAPYVDSFFVMAYDMDEANYFEAPLNCSSFCFSPVSPLNTYRFNVTKSMAQYTALVPGSQVILGQPYYGRRGCVATLAGGHQKLTRDMATPTYIFASTITSQSGVSNFHAGRDSDGVSVWNSWYDTDWACNREQYFDDVTSLAAKYNVILQDNLRGVGIWALDYGGSAPELWSLLNTYFSCTATVSTPATQTTTEFAIGLSSGSCNSSWFDIQQWDSTQQKGWFNVPGVHPVSGAASVNVEGYAGYSYQFRVRAHSVTGLVGAWSGVVSTDVSPTATASHPFSGLYTMDAYGGVNPDASPPLAGTAYWPGWKIARAVHALPGATAPQSGLVMDGYGGFHSYGIAITAAGAPYWNNWDIARDFAFLPDGTGGYLLDGYGGLHAFAIGANALPPAITGLPYWNGFDIARKLVINSLGTGGYVMDGYGGLHPFAIGANPKPPAATGAAYWPGWQIARDVMLIPGTNAGYVIDGYGGLHGFNGAPAIVAPAYWHGWDIARALWLLPSSTLSAPAGYTLDGYGGLHPFGGAPALTGTPYWNGVDIARSLWGG